MLAALTVYGLFSAPAPPEIRAAELAVAGLLVVASGLARPLAVVSGALLTFDRLRSWEVVGAVVFPLLLWLPLLRGIALDWQTREIVRDVVPLLYLFMPLLLVGRLRQAPERAVLVLAAGLALAGSAFTLRWWAEVHWAFGAIGVQALSDGLRYLLNSPAVLFGALWLPVAAAQLIFHRRAIGAGPVLSASGFGSRWFRGVLALGLLAAAGLITAALAATVHRMALGLVLIALLGQLGWWARRAPWPLGLAALAALLLVLVLAAGPVLGALALVVNKSEMVGFNQRFAEFEAVLNQIGRGLPSLMLGDGWGTLVANPAVGGWRVSYTHSFISYLLLKTGIIGVLAMVAWLATLTPAAVRLIRHDLPLALAVLPPLAGGLLLHTSFKYLCFGLLLTLLLLADERRYGGAGA